VQELVVGVDNPEACRVDVGVQQGVGHPGEDSKIILDSVVHLNTVFKEVSESLDVVGNVVLHRGVGYVVECAGAVVGVVDGIASNVAGVHNPRDMEVNWVSGNVR
jgi:hypothetical protein